MSERPILFNAESIRAILAGRKTQTRRIIKPQPPHWEWSRHQTERLSMQIAKSTSGHDYWVRCPYGLPGDTLWVKEGYQITSAGTGGYRGVVRGKYLADESLFEIELTPQETAKWERRKWPFRATPGLFMYKSLARIRTPVVSIRVERVRDISHEDTMAEVWCLDEYHSAVEHAGAVGMGTGYIPRQIFASLWDSIHGAGAWERNDWTWVVEFEEVGK